MTSISFDDLKLKSKTEKTKFTAPCEERFELY